MKIVILERDTIGRDVSVDGLSEWGDVTAYPVSTVQNAGERVRDAEIIIANKCPLNEETLKDAHQVRLICEFATGYDNIDIEYCHNRGIKVANVRNYSTEAVTQHTFALCFYILEKLHYYDDYVKSGDYGAQSGFSHFGETFTELAGKTWGIIGMGNIGRRVAQVAEAFGCQVIFYSPTGQSSCTEYERTDLANLLERSDVVSIHCPLSELTRGLIDLATLRTMKKSAILINVARGPIVKDEDLCIALTEGMIAGAGLDVTGTEPMTGANPLSRFTDSRRLIITPHMAWASTEARNRVVAETCENIAAFLRGEDRNIV
ncbi:MAG: hydroxyacid dehydrogenase [Lachnospiraceae bacterium]|jgi:glycerate dehydrogenase|nr:hydroxyacid dehydrogenase [Lachnospiraceae bacterium]